jgi:hypothetical protein
MGLSFEQLPETVAEIREQLNRIERRLSEGQTMARIDNDHKYLLPEAASFCRMPVSTFRSHLQRGHVVGSKPGRAWIFSRKNLDEFLVKFRSKSKEEIVQEAENILIKKSK